MGKGVGMAKKMTCPECGGSLALDVGFESCTCETCGKTFSLEELKKARTQANAGGRECSAFHA